MCIVLKLHHCTFILANDVMLSIGQYSIQRWCSYIVCLHACAPHSNAVTCNVTATIPYFLCTGCHDVCIVHTSVHAHVATHNSWQGNSLNWHRSLWRLCKRFGGDWGLSWVSVGASHMRPVIFLFTCVEISLFPLVVQHTLENPSFEISTIEQWILKK